MTKFFGNRKQIKFQKNIAMHVISYLPADAIYRSAAGTQVYCHPSREIEVRLYLEGLYRDLTYKTYKEILEDIMKFPSAN